MLDRKQLQELTNISMYAWGMMGGVSSLLSPRINRVLLGVVGILFGYFYSFHNEHIVLVLVPLPRKPIYIRHG
jgi:1,4-dihydroxy-2-naphthoate octaprenyltransferase